MKNLNIFKIISIFLVLIFGTVFVSAEELESSNFKIEGFSVTSGGGDLESTSYQSFVNVGEPAADDRLNSSSYRLGPGGVNAIQANIPLISCVGAQDGDSSECVAMATLCGSGGCADSAYFEIDVQNNPADALFGIQVRKTSDSEWSYLDGATNLLETDSTRTITDFKTKSDWESLSLNILGLDSLTEYQIRATALKGDYTESEPSPVLTFTTAGNQIIFDLDIDTQAGSATENSGPYLIDLGELTTSSVTTSDDKIWVDLSSNFANGTMVYIEDSNAGLQSASSSYTISSATADLSVATEGFGVRNTSITQTSGGPFVVASPYNGSGDNVGLLATSPTEIFNSSSASIEDGRASLELKAIINAATPAGADYTDEITFTVLVN